MTNELIAVAIVWVVIFVLLQSSTSFASVVYKTGHAPPWPSRALTAGAVTGFVAVWVGASYRRSHQFYGEELLGITIVMLAGGLCIIANRWFFKRWW